VTLYLLPSLKREADAEVEEGPEASTRVVSHAFTMGTTWPPDSRAEAEGKSVYLWIIK